MNDDHEDILRRVLRDQSPPVEPAAGAWERIESRTAGVRRQRRTGARAWVAVSTAAAVLVGVVAVASVTGNDRGTDVEAGPAERPGTPVTTAAPAPDAEPARTGDGPGIWPFRTGAEADSVSTDTWNDPVVTAERFLRDYVGFTRLVMGDFAEGDSRSGEVTATTRKQGPVTTVFVRRLGSGAVGPWTVVGAVTENIVLDRPTADVPVRSPVVVAGRSTAFEGNVVVEIRADGQTADQGELGLAPMTGGSMGEFAPLVGEVAFTETAASGGAAIAYTHSAMDGAIEEAAVIRLRFAPPPNPDVSDQRLPAAGHAGRRKRQRRNDGGGFARARVRGRLDGGAGAMTGHSSASSSLLRCRICRRKAAVLLPGARPVARVGGGRCPHHRRWRRGPTPPIGCQARRRGQSG